MAGHPPKHRLRPVLRRSRPPRERYLCQGRHGRRHERPGRGDGGRVRRHPPGAVRRQEEKQGRPPKQREAAPGTETQELPGEVRVPGPGKSGTRPERNVFQEPRGRDRHVARCGGPGGASPAAAARGAARKNDAPEPAIRAGRPRPGPETERRDPGHVLGSRGEDLPPGLAGSQQGHNRGVRQESEKGRGRKRALSSNGCFVHHPAGTGCNELLFRRRRRRRRKTQPKTQQK
mmetsp:Transcript_25634/g.54744  ORF Transcript_25634/g.54744 Transcript_25634/m.54744 type:complete len:232 (-) Transcript_25634:592-1287(-)